MKFKKVKQMMKRKDIFLKNTKKIKMKFIKNIKMIIINNLLMMIKEIKNIKIKNIIKNLYQDLGLDHLHKKKIKQDNKNLRINN